MPSLRRREMEPLLGRSPSDSTQFLKDADREIRADFIQKVYSVLTIQLLVTAAVAWPLAMNDVVRVWIHKNGQPLVVGACLLNIIFLLCMVCPCGCQENMRKFPLNYMLLAGFTVTEGILVGVVCASYTVQSVLASTIATGCLVGGLTAYAKITKTDFTTMGPYLFVGLMVMMIFSFFCMFLHFPWLHNLYCALGILVFSFYLIFDTQMVMGNGELALSVDDYVFAALQLYIDIVQLFLYILQLFGGDRD